MEAEGQSSEFGLVRSLRVLLKILENLVMVNWRLLMKGIQLTRWLAVSMLISTWTWCMGQITGPYDSGGWLNVKTNVGSQMDGPINGYVTFQIYGYAKCFQSIGNEEDVDWSLMFEELYDHEDILFSWYQAVYLSSGAHLQAWTYRKHGDYTENWKEGSTVVIERKNQYDVFEEEVLEFDIW